MKIIKPIITIIICLIIFDLGCSKTAGNNVKPEQKIQKKSAVLNNNKSGSSSTGIKEIIKQNKNVAITENNPIIERGKEISIINPERIIYKKNSNLNLMKKIKSLTLNQLIWILIILTAVLLGIIQIISYRK